MKKRKKLRERETERDREMLNIESRKSMFTVIDDPLCKGPINLQIFLRKKIRNPKIPPPQPQPPPCPILHDYSHILFFG